MTILTEELQEKILAEWNEWRDWRVGKKERNGFPSFVPPKHGEISISPRTKPTKSRLSYPKGWDNYDTYIKILREELLKINSNNERINHLSCFLHVTFRKLGGGDIDNLFKRFSDVIGGRPNKKGVFLKDDSQIIGVNANVIRVSSIEEEGISFKLIPIYEFKISSVDNIKTEEDLKKLQELRRKYAKLLEDAGHLNPKKQMWHWTSRDWQKGADIFHPWKFPMQMVTTNYGTFFDNVQGDMLGMGYYGNEPTYYEPQPGFNWESKKGKTVDGVMIYERSACWWINKWAEYTAADKREN